MPSYRGQDWVVPKFTALLLTIRDEAIHADLTAMLSSHERNIGLVAAELPTPDRSGRPHERGCAVRGGALGGHHGANPDGDAYRRGDDRSARPQLLCVGLATTAFCGMA